VAAGLVLLLVGLQRKERKREGKERIGAFGRNSFEFLKFKTSRKGVVMVC
jgi:hypothetical protein